MTLNHAQLYVMTDNPIKNELILAYSFKGIASQSLTMLHYV
jgi:hypothetical protein